MKDMLKSDRRLRVRMLADERYIPKRFGQAKNLLYDGPQGDF